MRKIFVLFLLCLILTGCVKYTSDYSTVTVTVSDAYFYPQTTRTVFKDGRFDHVEIDPPRYMISVEFEGRKYYFNNPEYYFGLYNKIGEQIDATLQKRQYENGNTKYEIVALKPEGEK